MASFSAERQSEAAALTSSVQARRAYRAYAQRMKEIGTPADPVEQLLPSARTTP